jgi:hypothetical protein
MTSRSYVSDICSDQRRKGRLGIKTSRRYDDASVLTFQVTVNIMSRDLQVGANISRIFVSRSNNTSGWYRVGMISPQGDIHWTCQRLGVETFRTTNVSEYKHLGLTQPRYGAAISRDLQVGANISRISSPRRLAEMRYSLLKGAMRHTCLRVR